MTFTDLTWKSYNCISNSKFLHKTRKNKEMQVCNCWSMRAKDQNKNEKLQWCLKLMCIIDIVSVTFEYKTKVLLWSGNRITTRIRTLPYVQGFLKGFLLSAITGNRLAYTVKRKERGRGARKLAGNCRMQLCCSCALNFYYVPAIFVCFHEWLHQHIY